MRLLYTKNKNEFYFTPDLLNDIPPYAILSHTWGPEHEEVIFTDIESGSVAAKRKEGYKKLLFCMNQARSDGIEHIWIDTCCIDKRNFTEYSEAINLMYRWYAAAKKCYVHMVDVRSNAESEWESAFRNSRWFTRGWTLQELLAPQSVEFFTYDGRHLGSRDQHAELISTITGIEIEALQGKSLTSFGIDRRFNWALGRRTKKPEDEIYSLLGLFGVSMTLNYAEGKEKALRRLKQEIVDQQEHEMGDPISRQGTSIVHELSRTGAEQDPLKASDGLDTLQNIKRRQKIVENLRFAAMDSRRSTIGHALDNTCNWILDHSVFLKWSDSTNAQFLWIKGHPGAGKSTIMKFVDYKVHEKLKGTPNVLISFYFNARGDFLERSVTGMYRSLIVQLIKAVPLLDRTLDELHFGYKVLPDPEYFEDVPLAVLKELFTALLTNTRSIKVYILIDALDETDEEEVLDMVFFLQSLCASVSKQGCTMSTCFASRHYPTLNIPADLQLVIDHEQGHTDDLICYVDINLHISNVTQAKQLKADVLAKSNGIFIWVVLVVGILNREFRRGNILLVQKKLQQIPGKMSELIQDISKHGDIDKRDFLLCLQWILFAQRPLTLEEFYFAMLAGQTHTEDHDLHWEPEQLNRDMMENFMLSNSKGLAELTKSSSPVVQFIHESVRGFLIHHGGLSAITEQIEDGTDTTGHEVLKKCCQRALVSGNISDCSLEIVEFERLNEAQKLRRDAATSRWPFLEYAAKYILHHAEHASQAISQRHFCQAFPTRLWCDVSIALNLIEWRGDRPTQRDERGRRPNADASTRHFFFVLLARRLTGLMRACIEANTHVLSFADTTGKTGLLWAVLDDEPEMVKLLISAGADVRVKDIYDHTALHFGREFGVEMLEVLLAADLDINAKDNLGRAPIHVFSGLDSADKLKVLLQVGCEIDATDRDGRTALHYAMEFGSLGCVEALIKAGINVNSADVDGYVALHIAAAGNLIETMKVLLRAGAASTAADNHNITALDLAVRRQYTDAIETLLEYGATIKSTPPEANQLETTTRKPAKRVLDDYSPPVRKGRLMYT